MNSAHAHRHANPLRLLLLAVFFLLAACSEVKEEALPSASRVLALGDSLTAGYGVTAEEAWPHLLAGKTGWQIANGGKSGDTSGGALQRLPALLEEYDPALVLVTLGGNDMLRHVPQAETVGNLEQIIVLILAHGAKPVLLATPQPSLAGAAFRNLSAADFYRQVAETQQVPLIEDAIADVLSNPDLKVDALHPNVAGHALLAEKIFEELKEIGFAH
jgi:lysophospholipase L1-like esterase